MNINSLKVKLTWDDINKAIEKEAYGAGLKDLNIIFEKNIVLKCRIKGGMPLSLNIDCVECDKSSIRFLIGKVNLFIKLPDVLKNSIIKDIIKKHIVIDNFVLYDEKHEVLTITKNALLSLLPFDDMEINSVDVKSEYIEIELRNVTLRSSDSSAGIKKVQDVQDIQEVDYIIENDDVSTESFTIDKANDYYDKLRTKIESYIKSGIPIRFHYLIPYLLMLPDSLALLIRLFGDKRIKASDKALVIAGITYIISPLDIIPDVILPFGAIDDLGIGFFVLDKLILSTPEEVLEDNFNGSENVLNFIKNGYSYVKNIIPTVKMDKVLKMFNDILNKNAKNDSK